MDQERKALLIQIEQLEKKNELMRKLATRTGFINHYFELLPKRKTNEAAFDELNTLYNDLFGHDRYNDYNSFKAAMNYHHNKNKK